ncbi:MAG: GGDEF domain-containing protein, partial [Erysipelothrix sp.]|nr:GGDEF domain-containing protein [Erysipelothrix sp.]
TDEIEQREYLIQRARIDGLTNLYNATYTKEYIDEVLKSKPEDRQDALLVIDLDNFKHFNDIYGHIRGDFILQEVAMALITSFEEARIIGRVGGDEFVVYLEDVVMENGECYQANNFMKELQKIDMDEPITASIGVKVIHDRSSYIEAFEDADRALYDIKDKKNQIGIYKGDTNGKV